MSRFRDFANRNRTLRSRSSQPAQPTLQTTGQVLTSQNILQNGRDFTFLDNADTETQGNKVTTYKTVNIRRNDGSIEPLRVKQFEFHFNKNGVLTKQLTYSTSNKRLGRLKKTETFKHGRRTQVKADFKKKPNPRS